MDEKTRQKEEETFIARIQKVDVIEDDTKCGFWFLNGKWMQKLANNKVFLVIHSITSILTYAGFNYYGGIVTTLEKHYKFSNTQLSIIGAVYDAVATVVCLIVPYYCSKGRFPRWIGLSIFCLAISSLIFTMPYFLYGAGSDALALTEEYDDTIHHNFSLAMIDQTKRNELCYENKTLSDCTEKGEDSAYLGTVLLFVTSNILSGFGGAIFGSLGAVYIDDNVTKSKAPLILSISNFVHLLSPAIGYTAASFCLKFYISPSLHPKINDEDPRWIGAWWMGFVVFAIILFILAPIIATFPTLLPRTAQRRKEKGLEKDDTKSSFRDLLQTFKRLIKNKAYFCNTIAAVFYCFGYVPFWIFQAKYIQIHFLFSASTANLITGTLSLVFSAVGLLTAGVIITIYKPRARYLSMWNIITSVFSVIGIIGYGFFSCTAGNNSVIMQNSQNFSSCNLNCNCDYVQYAPICGENNVTYASSCHAGCSDEFEYENGTKIFMNCRCINSTTAGSDNTLGGSAIPGACPLDCMPKFFMFFAILCLNKFFEGTEGTANFLLGMRCVDVKDKATALGLTSAVISFFAIIPSPIFFGWIFDSCCLYWGKTCSGTGNCWLYDTDGMRYTLNMTAASFVIVGTFFDIGTWYYSKDVQIFDDNENDVQGQNRENRNARRNGSLSIPK